MCQDVSPPHHPCCYYHFGNQVCPVHAHFPPSQPEWRKQLRGGGGLGGGKLAAAAGRRVARWPAACTCCRKNNTVLCFPQTLSARLRSVVIPPSSGCAGRGGAAVQMRPSRDVPGAPDKMDGGAPSPSSPARDQQLCCRCVRCLVPHLETAAASLCITFC